MNSESCVIQKEMGISHADLFRHLAAAIEPFKYKVIDQQIKIFMDEKADQCLTINFSDERVRRIASIQLPVTDLELIFTGLDQQQIDKFLKKFDQTFQRGGG